MICNVWKLTISYWRYLEKKKAERKVGPWNQYNNYVPDFSVQTSLLMLQKKKNKVIFKNISCNL